MLPCVWFDADIEQWADDPSGNCGTCVTVRLFGGTLASALLQARRGMVGRQADRPAPTEIFFVCGLL